MRVCPCCSNELLKHVRPSGVYWFCLRCRQEMPDITVDECQAPNPVIAPSLSKKP